MNTTITLGEFMGNVRCLRLYQKQYYDYRNVYTLSLVKKYEALVDGAINDYEDSMALDVKQKQQELFAEKAGVPA